jgi:hypothetical protein
MFGILQIVVKVVIIAVIVLVAIVASLKIWRFDLDLGQLFSPRRAVEKSVEQKLSWLPTREKESLYQNKQIVARIVGASVKEGEGQIHFEEIYESERLDLGSEFEFQKYRLRFRSAETLTMVDSAAPQKGRIITEAVCEIIGVRDSL